MRAAILQMTSGIDPAANARVMIDAATAAKSEGADMLFTPEMAGYLDRDRRRAAAMVRREDEDLVLAAMRDTAARLGLWIQVGSLPLAGSAGSGRHVNRSFVIDDGGAIRARYDKIHLFDVDLQGGESWRESAAYAPGQAAVAVDTPWARLGLSVCYDLRFPDLYRALSDAGATILLVPSAFTVPTGKAHWHILLRARAIEAGAFVIAPAQCGRHDDGRTTYGHSLVADPWGEILLDMEEGPGLAFCDLDLGKVVEARARIPALDHRRAIPEVQLR